MNRRRILATTAALAATLVGLLPMYGVAGNAAGPSCAHVRTHNGWSTIDRPAFPANAGTVTTSTFLIAEANGVLFISDGRTVMRSLTAGCTWQQVFTLNSNDFGTSVTDDEAKADPENTIQSMVALPSPKGRAANTIYLATADALSTFTFAAGTPVYVFASHDDGATWGPAEMPLATPSAADPSGLGAGSSNTVRVIASPASPKRVYVATQPVVFGAYADPNLVHQQVASAPATAAPLFGLFTSADSGATWRHPAPSGLPSGNSTYLNTMVANPVVDGTLYLATGISLGTSFGLYRSTDAGTTWKHMTDVPGATWQTTPRLGAGGRTILMATATTAYLSTDGGRRWTSITQPVVVGGGWSLSYGNTFVAGPKHTLVDVLVFNSSWGGTKPVTVWQVYNSGQRTWKAVPTPVVDTGRPKSKPQVPGSYSTGVWADAPGGPAIDQLVYVDNVEYWLRHTGSMK